MKQIFPEASELPNYTIALGPSESPWGLISRTDHLPLKAGGMVSCSVNGQRHSSTELLTSQTTPDVREHIQQLFASADSSGPAFGRTILERFVNLDDITLDHDAFTELQLTLFLQPSEGALVFLSQHSATNADVPFPVQYLMPQEDAGGSEQLATYLFHVEKWMSPTAEVAGHGLVIHVLTFPQPASTKTGRVEHLSKRLLTFEAEDAYSFQIFKPAGFKAIEAADIDRNKRTLFLLHGTFSTTAHSFEHLTDGSPELRAIDKLVAEGGFEQIVGFDHPTIVHNADQNTAVLLRLLKESGGMFTQPVSIVTTSRGALVAHSMVCNEELSSILTIDRIVCFSAANGCGYFAMGQHLSRFLGIWRMTFSGPALKAVLSIAQVSATFFLSQPGCRMMNPESGEVDALLSRPVFQPRASYHLVISDWHSCLEAHESWFHHLAHSSLDLLIKMALGDQHDWVISCEAQSRAPQRSLIAGKVFLHSVHGRYLEKGYVRSNECRPVEDPVDLLLALLK